MSVTEIEASDDVLVSFGESLESLGEVVKTVLIIGGNVTDEDDLLLMGLSVLEFLFEPCDMFLRVSESVPDMPVHVIAGLSIETDYSYILELLVNDGHGEVSFSLE